MRLAAITAGAITVSLLLLSGCASRSIIPSSLENQVDDALTFAQLKRSPEAYTGRLVVLGGEVLSARRLEDATRIEILQLPLEEDHEPQDDRMTSEGRFLAFRKTFLDPATLPRGTRVTIVGEVTGSRSLPLDETEYTYPTLAIKHLTVWPEPERIPSRYRPYYYWGPPWSYWGPYWPYGRYPYWW